MTRGAGLALLGRMGALVEAAGFPIFLWLYGSVTFGLFATLYAIVRMASGVTQMGMDVALQRFIPSYDDEDVIHRTLAIALVITMGAGIIGALFLIIYAPLLAQMINGNGEDNQHIVTVIRLYAVTLPLWTSVEVLTASVRSRRKFGPEIRIRFFYEQILRILIAVGLAFAGFTIYGLFLAHILSLAIAALLSFFLVARFYDYKRLFMAGYDPKLAKAMLHFALPMMPATLIQRIFSEFPVLVLNIIIPGAAGASAAGFYSIARKLSSVMQVIHNSFDYVVAPLAAFQKGRGDRETLADMYAYSTRLMVAFGVILAGAWWAAIMPCLICWGLNPNPRRWRWLFWFWGDCSPSFSDRPRPWSAACPQLIGHWAMACLVCWRCLGCFICWWKAMARQGRRWQRRRALFSAGAWH
ncbi:hypothetical protein JCM17846_12000 [Iodidimonas nitroreducens]|uniref:Polysaccharide biosynthesis protein C-terminal domain-containing protein n=2 Tax=Iodidimonas nitroreducens TaxID=1236968 RepID=A0A5A7N604_9PROT|nr:hypothetical protein JCM17846_12000 [Iodidimonas nitroreducens]